MKVARQDWPQLLNLMDEALQVPTRARRRWLELLAQPEAVKASLRGLLDARRAIETDDFLGDLAYRLPPQASTTAGAEPGSLVGPWRLVRELGRGGMSTVWLAERADAQLHRQVALKLPHAGAGPALLAQRLMRERDILAGLEHPHIARLYDVGLTEAGLPYMVMEYVPGQTLLAHADARRLTAAQRLALFQQVLAAVQYAHSRLVLHRDLKPGNILVSDDGQVKLLDFGIAKLLAGEGAQGEATELTRAAGRALTPEYASPEQLLDEPLGTASDVYSLGAVLYELLCGVRPHALAGLTPAQREAAVVRGDTRAPSRRVGADSAGPVLSARQATAAELRRALAGDVDAVVLKALAREPVQRYGTVEAFAKDVSRCLSGKPVSAQAPTLWYHLAKFVRRHRLAVGLGSAAVIALAGFGSAAVVQGLAAQREAAKAVAVRNFMVDVFRDANPELSQGREPTGRELLRRSRERLLAAAATPAGAALPVNDLLEGLADAQFKMGDFSGADATLAAVCTRMPSEDPGRARVLLSRAKIALNLRELTAAREALNDASVLIAASGASRQSLREFDRLSGHVALHALELQAARRHFQAYFDAAPTPETDDPANMLAAQLALADLASRSGQRDESFGRLAIAQRYAEEHSAQLPLASLLHVAHFRAGLEVAAGRYEAVRQWLPQQVALCDRDLGALSPACRVLKDQLVRVLLKQGYVHEAAALAPAMLEWAKADDTLAGKVRSAAGVARAFAMAGKAEALAPVEQLLQSLVTDGTVGESGASLQAVYRLQAFNTLAELRLLAGQPQAAQDWLAKARALDHASREQASTGERRKTELFEGIALQQQGRHREALDAFGTYCDEGVLATEPMQVLQRFFSLNCAPSLAAVGRAGEAVSLVENAMSAIRAGYGANAPSVRRAERLLERLKSVEPQDHRPDVSPPEAPSFFS